MDTTPNLSLPYIFAAQAQKHVTHNEAIRRLDALVQLAVIDRDLSVPPETPADGDRFIVGANPQGAWIGGAGRIAAYQDGVWTLIEPHEGWLAWVADEDTLLAWNGSEWASTGAGAVTELNPATGGLLGVNATADTTNRLAINAPASLFNHEGNGHQIKMNKALAGDTASLLYQTGFSGRAELGTTGDDKWHLKVSADGSAWSEAMVVTSDGKVGFGTDNPSGLGGDVVVARNIDGPAIAKVYNLSGGGEAEARVDFSTGAANAYALFGIYNGVGSPIFYTHGGSGITLIYFDWNTHLFRSSAGVERLRIDSAGTKPGTDNAYTLGGSGARWSEVWAANGTIQTSDARDKDVTGRIDGKTAAAAIDAIEPVMFRWKTGGNEWIEDGVETVPHPQTGEPMEQPRMVLQSRSGTRLHAGFLAQEVKAAMGAAGVDFGVWGLDDKDDPESRQWLRPDQIIPVLWAALRETRAELEALKAGG